MKAIRAFHVLTLAGALAIGCAAAKAEESKQPAMSKEQQAMMQAMQKAAEVRPEHKQLEYFVGNWNTTTTMESDGKSPPMKSEGKSHSETIFGGRYVRMMFDGTFEGQPFKGEGFMGFDNIKGKFLNTWIDSVSTGYWLAYGTYDAASKTYTFHGDMPDYAKPEAKMAVRQVMHIVDANHYTFEWYETHSGKEIKVLQIDYSKK